MDMPGLRTEVDPFSSQISLDDLLKTGEVRNHRGSEELLLCPKTLAAIPPFRSVGRGADANE
jgi:hypothetical protein